jgi:hypothetical protein
MVARALAGTVAWGDAAATSVNSPCSAHRTCLTVASCHAAENCAKPSAAINTAANNLATTAPFGRLIDPRWFTRRSIPQSTLTCEGLTSKAIVEVVQTIIVMVQLFRIVQLARR